jgi:hypothetical protein
VAVLGALFAWVGAAAEEEVVEEEEEEEEGWPELDGVAGEEACADLLSSSWAFCLEVPTAPRAFSIA